MASIKHLRWLLIPVFAILLMSHNTFAIEPDAGVVFTYVGSGGIYTSCNYSATTSMCTPTNPSITGFSFYPASPITLTPGSYWLEAYVTFSSNGSTDAPLVVGVPTYSPEGTIVAFDSVSSTTRGSTTVRIYRLLMKWSGGTTINSSNSINISNSSAWVNTNGYMVNSITFYKEVTDTDASNQQIINAINNLNSTVSSNTPPSAEEIADAINEPEEQATENISNQSADDYEMESANMSSLFSQFGNFISAVNGASIGDCNIPANFNHLDLGILNLCANPVPDYVQVAVSIVLCMLIAPYLMNIIKRILSIADRIREV